MKSEETIYDNKVNNEESTQLNNQSQGTQEQAQNVIAEEAPKTGKKSVWRRVATGMGAGILLGGVSSFLMGSTVVAQNENEEIGGNVNDGGTGGGFGESEGAEVFIGLEDGDVDMATTVDDDMSFSEAFATARAEVGGGGAFVWNGDVYSTYTAEEWDAMTEEQRDGYYDRLNWSNQDIAQTDPVTSAEAGIEVLEAGPGNTAPEVEIVAVVDEPEIEILGVAHDAETGANIGVMTVDDQEIVFVDVNDDNTFDYAVADVDQDGQLTDDEMAYVEDQQLTVEMFEDAAMNDDYLASNDAEPDYVNDALV